MSSSSWATFSSSVTSAATLLGRKKSERKRNGVEITRRRVTTEASEERENKSGYDEEEDEEEEGVGGGEGPHWGWKAREEVLPEKADNPLLADFMAGDGGGRGVACCGLNGEAAVAVKEKGRR